MIPTAFRLFVAPIASAIVMLATAQAAQSPSLADVVARVARPLMKAHGIPGMAIGVITPEGTEFFTFGVASRATRNPVTAGTLFEIGSVSKTFTATLATLAEARGYLALSDSVTAHLPELKGGALDRVSLLNLATHTSGGMPLQFPDWVTSSDKLMDYYRAWTPTKEPGSSRTYANPSIGLLGLATARAMNADFDEAMESTIYEALDLKNTYLDVPDAAQAAYAQGHTKADAPIRMSPGMLADEAYGVRTTVGDLTRFVEANMGRVELDPEMAKAIRETHTAYYAVGALRQALVWEQYAYPVELADLLAGNSAEIAYKPHAVTSPPEPSGADAWINKTGSTNGFGAYVAFVPSKDIGIVILANKNYPNEARVTAAYEILTTLGGGLSSAD